MPGNDQFPGPAAVEAEAASPPDTSGLVRAIRAIDKVGEWTGKITAVLCIPLVLGLVFEVFSRYGFRAPTDWAYDVTYMLYGTMFMIGASYALHRKAHIRTDLFYRLWSAKTQGKVDAFCYLFLYFPGLFFYLNTSWAYFLRSWAIKETNGLTAWQPPLYPFKFVIVVAIVLLLVQGVAEFLKSVHAAQRGEWL